MPEFSYSAFDADGQKRQGSIIAPSKSEARLLLEKQNFFIETLSASLLVFDRQVGVKDKVFLQFNKELSSLLRAGLPLVESMLIVSNRSDDPTFGAVLGQVVSLLKDGCSFSEACARYPNVFDDIFISNLKTGEKSGNLYHALNEYQKYLNQRIQFRGKLKKALAYPLFLVFTLVAVLGFLFVFIVPSFSELFASFNAELPLATQVVMSGAHFFPYFAALALAVAIVFYLYWRSARGNEALQQRLDALRLKLPLVGEIIQHSRYIQLTRNVSTMLSAGMPLLTALENLQSVYRVTAFGGALGAIKDDVMNGSAFHMALSRQGFMSEQAIKLIEVGESSGDLERMLSEVADYFEGVLDERLSVIMSLFEPVLMLVIGFMVGGIIVSMYLPIFYLAEVVK